MGGSTPYHCDPFSSRSRSHTQIKPQHKTNRQAQLGADGGARGGGDRRRQAGRRGGKGSQVCLPPVSMNAHTSTSPTNPPTQPPQHPTTTITAASPIPPPPPAPPPPAAAPTPAPPSPRCCPQRARWGRGRARPSCPRGGQPSTGCCRRVVGWMRLDRVWGGGAAAVVVGLVGRVDFDSPSHRIHAMNDRA